MPDDKDRELVIGRKCPACGLALCCQCKCNHSKRERVPELDEMQKRERTHIEQ